MAWPSTGGRSRCCQWERHPSLFLDECGHIFQARYFIEEDQINLLRFLSKETLAAKLQSSLCHRAMSDGRALVVRVGYGGSKITFTIVMSCLTAASDELILGYGVRITGSLYHGL
ncbi:hypothetical protein ZWY2020_027095 [Hordeum vulgare]|nr:hypothetical protein ZWY2020_027095 [Hordeum vulgare]